MQTVPGIELKICRIRAGVPQYKLAQRLGIPSTILCDLENGRRRLTETRYRDIVAVLSEMTAERIGEAFGVAVA